MDNVAELVEKHPVLAALIKLEVSNSLLRLQLGEDPTSCLQSRLDAALLDNSSLVLKVAEKDPISIQKMDDSKPKPKPVQEGECEDGRRKSSNGGEGVIDKVKNMVKRRTSKTAEDMEVPATPSASTSSNHNNGAVLTSLIQSPVPMTNAVGASVPRAQKRVVSVRRPSYDAMAPSIGGSLAANGQFATPVRAVDEDVAEVVEDGADGDKNTHTPEAEAASVGGSPVKSVANTGVEDDAGVVAGPPPDANYLEMCEVGVDRSILSGAKPAVTSLQRAQVVNKFPTPAGEQGVTAGGCLDSSVVPNITEFCFPRGVPLDIVSATAADVIAGPQFDTYHVMQFSDADGNRTFGCCIIITEKIRPSSDVVELQLMDLQRQKKASNIICTRMKEYIRYKEHMRWAVKPAGVDRNIGNKAQRRRASMSSIPSGANTSDNGDAASVNSDMNSPGAKGGELHPGESGYKRSVFSKFFSRKDAATPSETSHRPELTTPGPVGAMYPYGETPSGEFVSPHGPSATGKSAFKTPGGKGEGKHSAVSMATPGNAADSPTLPGGPPPSAVKAPNPSQQTPAKTPAKKRFSWFGGPSVPATPAPEPAAPPLPSLLEEMQGDTGTGPISPPLASNDMSPPGSEPQSSRCTSVSEAESESGDDGFIAEDGQSHEDDNDTTKLHEALGAMYDLNLGRNKGKKRDKNKSKGKDDDSSSDGGSAKDRTKSPAAPTDQPLPLGSSATVVETMNNNDAKTPSGHFSPVPGDSGSELPVKPATSLDASKRLSLTKAGEDALQNDKAAEGRESISIDTDAKALKRAGRGKMIVTKKAFCILSRSTNHAFLFKVLQKIIDTEARSAAGRSRIPSIASIGGGGVVDEAEYASTVNNILADINVCDTPVTSNVSLSEAISQMTVSNRHKFLMDSMCCDLSSVIECHSAPSTMLFDDQNPNNRPGTINATMTRDRLSSLGFVGANTRLGREQGKSFDEVEEQRSVAIECRSYFHEPLVISQSLSSFKEWSCSILFATISHTLIIKIMNLLLLEKSILIYGTDVGIVSAIASALIELAAPFSWEGVFVPVMPYIAKEVLQAPVPFIIGSTSLPKMEDLSPNAAIIFLDAKLGCRDVPIEECAWFMSIPEVDANMPVGESLSKLLKHANQRLSKYLPLYKERMAKWAANTTISLSRQPSATSTASAIKIDDIAVPTPPSSTTHAVSVVSPPGSPNPVTPASPMATAPVRCRRSPADLQKTFLYDLSDDSKIIIHKVLDAVARHNVAFCGDAAHTGGWIRYCKYNKNSGMEEFYPSWFMQPRRATTEFQEALVQTQLFVSYLDKLRIVYEKNTWQR